LSTAWNGSARPSTPCDGRSSFISYVIVAALPAATLHVQLPRFCTLQSVYRPDGAPDPTTQNNTSCREWLARNV
jgi:hypothetical protein